MSCTKRECLGSRLESSTVKRTVSDAVLLQRKDFRNGQWNQNIGWRPERRARILSHVNQGIHKSPTVIWTYSKRDMQDLKAARKEKGPLANRWEMKSVQKAAYPQATTSQDHQWGPPAAFSSISTPPRSTQDQSFRHKQRVQGLHRPSEKEAPEKQSGQQEGKCRHTMERWWDIAARVKAHHSYQIWSWDTTYKHT